MDGCVAAQKATDNDTIMARFPLKPKSLSVLVKILS
jgi:hypothetical protein